MKLRYIGIFRYQEKTAVELCAQRDLSGINYFKQGTVNQFMTFIGSTICPRVTPGKTAAITSEEFSLVSHVRSRLEGICGILIADEEYPQLVAQSLLSKICEEFLSRYPRTTFETADKLPYPELGDYLSKYQDPQQADSIMKIQKELEETKTVMNKTLGSLLERGEKIEDLVDKSTVLSAQSKMFYTQAKKQNSCCVVM